MIDARWMHDALSSAGVADGARLIDVRFAGYIGTGQMGRNARYELTWDEPEGRPATVVGKFPTDDPVGRASGFSGAYLKEWTFYRELAQTVNVRAPACHVALFDEPGQNFVLLMEDMVGSVQGDQMRGLTEDEAALGIQQAVALHAPRWGDPSLAQLTFSNATPLTPAEHAARLHDIYAATHEPTLARLGPSLPDEVIDLVRRFAPKVGAWTTRSDAPSTMLHMDFRPDNFLFGVQPGAPPLAIVDWQTIATGPGTHDIAYMIGGSFEPSERARVERGLVESYRRQLAHHGVEYPVDACWRDFRISSLWGVIMSVIATMLAAQTERGDLMFITMLRRHASQAIELDALDLLG